MTTSRDGKKVPSRSAKTRSPATAPMRVRHDAEPAAEAFAEPVPAHVRTRMIAEQAYYLAEARGFAAGHELEDWLAAERLVDDRLAGAPGS